MSTRFSGVLRGWAVTVAALSLTLVGVPALAEPAPSPSPTPSSSASSARPSESAPPSEEDVAAAEARTQAKREAVAKLRAEIAAEEQKLDDLRIAAALAAEKYNGAKEKLAAAKAESARRTKAATAATEARDAAHRDLAELARSQLQVNPGILELAAIMEHGPAEILERADRMTTLPVSMEGKLAALRTAEEEAVAGQRRAERAQQAVAERTEAAAEARARAEAAADEQQEAVEAYRARRAVLLTELAAAEEVSLRLATQRQEQVEADRDRAQARGAAAARAELIEQTGDVSAPSAGARAAIDFAYRQLGDPYVWGAEGPDSWDCSGLTMKAWAAGGKDIGHYTGIQWSRIQHIAESDLQPGDLIFWSTDPSNPVTIYHVGLYIGGGQMIHAPRPGKSVEVQNVYYWQQPTFFGRP